MLMPICSLRGWYLEQGDLLATPFLTVVRRDELLNPLMVFFFTLQITLRDIPIIYKKMGFFFRFFFLY